MKSVTEAKKLIMENCRVSKHEVLSLSCAYGYILAEPAFSLIDTPPFNQSAMDGYAFSFDGWDGKSNLTLTDEIQAGNYSSRILKPSETARIFTGAALPSGTDTVVMQEKVIINGTSVSIKDHTLSKGSNVRLQGAQVKKGEITLREGHLLSPASVSFLAGTGIDSVKVYSKPTVSIIVTGNELVMPGNPVPAGKIYESNSFGLASALNQLNISPVSVEVIEDDENKIIRAIKNQLHADIIIMSGGVSAGDYDLVPPALEKCAVNKIFHKVRQKPGMPFYFGRHHQTLVFALPGNPAAVLSCFYQYIVPAIGGYTRKNYFKKLQLSLANDFRKKPGLTFFLKGKTNGNEVAILDNQESYMMNSFAIADCLVELDEDKEIFKKGEKVNVSMII